MKLKDLFYLQKSDRKAIIFLLALCALIVAGIFFIGKLEIKTDHSDPFSAEKSILKHRSANSNYSPYTYENRHIELFPFDPNTADSTALRRLGLARFQIRNIYRYRAKGGVYRSPMDFARLYGLTRKQFRQLEPYIKISPDYMPASTLPQVVSYREKHAEEIRRAYEQFKKEDNYEPYKKYDRDTVRFPIKIKAGQHINLAQTDTSQLKKVPGIGSGWARTIISYGRRLGGYIAVGQLREIDGFPEESLPYFEIRNPRIDKINLNRLTLNQLRRHPYINFYQAKQICEYRRLKGPLTNLSQLSILKEFPPEAINRLKPYVEF